MASSIKHCQRCGAGRAHLALENETVTGHGILHPQTAVSLTGSGCLRTGPARTRRRPAVRPPARTPGAVGADTSDTTNTSWRSS